MRQGPAKAGPFFRGKFDCRSANSVVFARRAPIMGQSHARKSERCWLSLASATSLLTVQELRTKITHPMLAYLSGSIEYAPDKGKTWRASLTPFFCSLGHDVYDPAVDEKKNLTAEEVSEFRKWKISDPARFRGTIRKIIDWDLDWIEKKCDYVIAYWDEYAQRGAGTGAELSFAYRRGVPVYLVAGVPIDQISGWILGCAAEVFINFDQLREFLAKKHAPVQEQCTCCASRIEDSRSTQAGS
jgi:nucleoside 2-deoxyribosyltransferase